MTTPEDCPHDPPCGDTAPVDIGPTMVHIKRGAPWRYIPAHESLSPSELVDVRTRAFELAAERDIGDLTAVLCNARRIEARLLGTEASPAGVIVVEDQ